MLANLQIAIIGYGRFGQALGQCLQGAGAKLRAYDPSQTLASEIAAASLVQAVQGAQIIILANPVAKTSAILREVRPHLQSQQLVMDVGSVKSGPAALMQEICGKQIPWVATHPLFGPTSLAMGEQPLRVVVCPNAMHPQACKQATLLYQELGCEVIHQDVETHDQHMAQTHALAYFVAKGFLDAGIELDSPLAPPSAQAIARTVEAVQEDAAHLFASLHRHNPYAEVARQKLLDALSTVDQALRAPMPEDEEAHAEGGALHIEGLQKAPASLRKARDVIDAIDRDLLTLLARRAQVSLRAAQAKAEVGHGIRDPRRESALLESRSQIASEMGLDGSSITEIFQAILRFSRRHQTNTPHDHHPEI